MVRDSFHGKEKEYEPRNSDIDLCSANLRKQAGPKRRIGDDLLLDTIWGRVQKCASYFLSVRGPRGPASATTPGGAAPP